MNEAGKISELADVQVLAAELEKLPKEALLYIAGYAEGSRDKPKPQEQEQDSGHRRGGERNDRH